jgi:hypothetical protein
MTTKRQTRLPRTPIDNERVARDVAACSCYRVADGRFVRHRHCSVHASHIYLTRFIAKGDL